MEPDVPQGLKYAIGMVWIALAAAIIVTVLDWKIKQDILRLTDAFYKIYPTPAGVKSERAPRAEKPNVDRYIPGDFVHRDNSVDTDSRVETGTNTVEDKSVDSEASEEYAKADWSKWLSGQTATESDSRTTEDS